MRYHFGACTLDDERESLRRGGEIIAIEPQALRVLRYLLAHRDRVVSRNELLEHCWPETYVSDASLSNCMSRVREAIGQRRGGVTLIETVHRRGYRFVGEVREVASASAPALPPDTASSPVQESEDQTSAPLLEPSPTPSAVPSSPFDTAERRHVSVLSCTLCGAEGLAEQLDADDHYELMQGFLSSCVATVLPYEGHVVQQSNHGVVVYFGWPQAHEDDAQRAVRSGLALVSRVGRQVAALLLSAPRPAIQVGIASGMMLIAPQTTLEVSPTLGAGRPVSQAMRLGALAAPDTVVISSATAQLVSGYFACKELAPATPAGDAASEVAYRVLGESALQTRLAVRTAQGLTPFVGREAEVALLRDRWAYVQEGMGQVVWIQGEAGLGKSRLVEVLKETVADEPVLMLECRCSPYHQHTAFYPLMDLMQRSLLVQSASSDNSFEALEAQLGQYGLALDETVPILAGLLSLALPAGRYAPLNLTPQRQRERTLEVLWLLLQVQASRSPLLFVVQDVHWIDPSTLEFLQLVLTQVASVSMLMVLTSRPGFAAPWGQRAEITPVVLNRLTRGQTEAMIVQVAGGKPLPAAVLAQVVEKTDGVPLFVEELTRMVLESGQLVERQGQYELVGALSGLSIPRTLHDSLVARLDRLGVGKDLAQWGSVLGREFSYEVLEAVTPYDEATLQGGLQELVASGLVFQRGLLPQTRYRFKHALIQDAAYDALPRRRRQAMHGQVVQVLERHFPALVETQPEVVAHHYTEAACPEQAIGYWQQAGQRAAERSANEEAMRHLTTGLALLATRPDTPARTRQELALHMALGPVLMATRGQAATEVEQTYTRAWALCQQVGETPQRFPALRGLWRFYHSGGRLSTAREIAEQLLSLAQGQHDATRLLAARVSLGFTLAYMGAFTAARPHLEQGIALTDSEAQRTLALRYGAAPGVQCLSYAAFTLWCLGYPDQGLERSQTACTLARELEHPLSLALALFWAIRLHLLRGEAQAAREQAEALIALSTAHTLAQYVAAGRFAQGWALAAQGQGEEGVTLMRQGVTDIRATGNRVIPTHFLPVLAEVSGTPGQVDTGLTTVTEALELAEQTGVRWYEAETYRIKGTLLLCQADPDAVQADACFHQALDIARQQEAKSWELRAAVSLARLWQFQGKRQEATDLLAPVYDWFTEGFDTADLQGAKALLEELA